MTVSLNIRRTGVLLVVVLGALAVVGSAQSGIGQGIPPQSAIDAASANWAAKAKLLDINGRPVSSVTVPDASGSTGLDRRDFGMGAGAMLGLVLISGGVFAGVHFGRRSTVRTRPSS